MRPGFNPKLVPTPGVGSSKSLRTVKIDADPILEERFERTQDPAPILSEAPEVQTEFEPTHLEAALVATINKKPVNEAEAIEMNAAIKIARERSEFLLNVIAAYYPTDHPNLEVVEGDFYLDRLANIGRTDEVGALRKVSLAVPHALDGDFTFSPTTEDKDVVIDLDRALRQHAALVSHLLENGVKVFLQIQPEEASEAVYNTDVLTALGNALLVGNPMLEERKHEIKKFKGGVQLEKFGGEAGPIEFGDILLFKKGNKQYVFQGCNSYRATQASVAAMDRALTFLKRKGAIDDYELVQVDLTGKKTLHLDYCFGYAGEGDQRVMVVYPEGFQDPAMVDVLAEILEIPEERIIRVNLEESIAGATNLSSLNPNEVLYIKNPAADRVADEIRSHGLKVTQFEYDQMSEKDGTLHCSIGQLARD